MANYLSPEDPVNLLAARMNPNIAAQGAKARANMAPPTSIMDPRYPAWKKSQDDAELLMLMSDMALSAIPLAGPAARGAMATGRALAPTAGRMTENYLARSGGILPMDTWHGSPHLFPPTAKNPLGEFDPMKIGTGEGAQAYGHGLYLAENRTTAQTYNPNPGIASAAWDRSMKYWTDKLARNDNPVVAAKEIAILKEKMAKQTGYLYKVDLPDEQIAKMLNWDKKLKDQPDILKAVLESPKYKDRRGFDPYPEMTGKDLYEMGHDQVKSLGIPGIRYLDQGSRAGGKGTSNFVVFDPAHMDILERNGVTAASLRAK